MFLSKLINIFFRNAFDTEWKNMIAPKEHFRRDMGDGAKDAVLTCQDEENHGHHHLGCTL